MTPAQCRTARELLGWEPADLARAAGVSVITVRNFESGKPSPQRSDVTAMRLALEGAGVTFSGSDPAGKAGVGTVGAPRSEKRNPKRDR